MRIVVLAALWLLGCAAPSPTPTPVPSKPPTLATTVVDWLRQQADTTAEYTLVFTFSANDCVPCMRGFSQLFRQVIAQKNPAISVVVVFENVRPAERPALLRAVFQTADTASQVVVWNTAIFQDALAQVIHGKGVSALLVYDARRQLVFSKFGKMVMGTEPELQRILQRKK